MSREVEALVIGAGPGGYVAAIRLSQLGVRTVLVDKDKLGGVCLNYGCIPSKALINAANLVHKARNSGARGITAEVTVDFAKMQAWKDEVVQKLVNGIALLCMKNGVEVVKGEVRFLSPTEVEVTSARGSEVFEPGAVIVATGGRPIELPGLEFDHEVIMDSRDMLELQDVPDSLLVVGGGITGLEIGSMYAKLGSRVTVVELLEQLIPGLDTDLVRVLQKSLVQLGFEIHVNSKVTSIERVGGRAKVKFETPEGVVERDVDTVFVTVGRRPNVEDMGLEAAGVELDDQGFVRVDEKLLTSAPNVYAIGDCIGTPYLAHRSSKEGLIAAEVIAGHQRSVDWQAMPAAIFTDPEIATVGLSEEEAKAAGRSVKAGKFPFAALGRALASDDAEGFVKIIMDEDTEEIIGVRIVGPEASNLISEAALAMEMGATAEDVALTVHPHPTLPEAVMEAAEAVLGKAIHVVNR